MRGLRALARICTRSLVEGKGAFKRASPHDTMACLPHVPSHVVALVALFHKGRIRYPRDCFVRHRSSCFARQYQYTNKGGNIKPGSTPSTRNNTCPPRYSPISCLVSRSIALTSCPCLRAFKVYHGPCGLPLPPPDKTRNAYRFGPESR